MLSRATPSASSLTEHFIVPLTGWLGATAGKPTREISKRGNEWPLQRLLGNSSQIDALLSRCSCRVCNFCQCFERRSRYIFQAEIRHGCLERG